MSSSSSTRLAISQISVKEDKGKEGDVDTDKPSEEDKDKGNQVCSLVHIVFKRDPYTDSTKKEFQPWALTIIGDYLLNCVDVKNIALDVIVQLKSVPSKNTPVWIVRTSGRFRIEYNISDPDIIIIFNDSQKDLNCIRYMSEQEMKSLLDEIEAELEQKAKDVSNNLRSQTVSQDEETQIEQKRLQDLLAAFNEGINKFRVMRQKFHSDFPSWQRMYKEIFMCSENNGWSVGLNNGQMLYQLKFEQNVLFQARDIFTGQVDIQALVRTSNGELVRTGQPFRVLHSPNVSEGRVAVQVKRPDAVFEKAVGITPSIRKALADALIDDPTGKKLEQRTLELVKDAKEWKCAKRELNDKTFTMKCMKSSEMSSTFSEEFGHFVQNSQFLCFSKSKSVTNSPFFTKLLELNDEIENDSEKINHLDFDGAQFVIFRAESSDGSIQPFIMCLGSFVSEMARSFHQDSNSYYKMRTVQHSINFTHDELKLVTTNDELFEYLTRGITDIESVAFQIREGSVFKIGNFLVKFSASSKMIPDTNEKVDSTTSMTETNSETEGQTIKLPSLSSSSSSSSVLNSSVIISSTFIEQRSTLKRKRDAN
jgi:hypothetical protein